MAHCECILDTQSCNECPSYVDAESSKVVKGQFHWEKIPTCYFCTKKHILLLCYFHLGSFSLMDRTVEENHVSWITTTVPPMQVCVTLFFQAAKMHVMRVLGVSDSDLSLYWNVQKIEACSSHKCLYLRFFWQDFDQTPMNIIIFSILAHGTWSLVPKWVEINFEETFMFLLWHVFFKK